MSQGFANNSTSTSPAPINDPNYYASVRSLYVTTQERIQRRKTPWEPANEARRAEVNKFNAFMAGPEATGKKYQHRVILLNRPSIITVDSSFQKQRGNVKRVQKKKFEELMLKADVGSGNDIAHKTSSTSNVNTNSNINTSPNTTPSKRPAWEELSPELKDDNTWSDFLRMGEVWEGDAEPVIAAVKKVSKPQPKKAKVKGTTNVGNVTKKKDVKGEVQSSDPYFGELVRQLDEEDTLRRIEEGLPPRDDVGPLLWW